MGSVKEPKNRFHGTNSAGLCSLEGRYDNPIPTRFPAPKDFLKFTAQPRHEIPYTNKQARHSTVLFNENYAEIRVIKITTS
jgi:hypothetical protein